MYLKTSFSRQNVVKQIIVKIWTTISLFLLSLQWNGIAADRLIFIYFDEHLADQ